MTGTILEKIFNDKRVRVDAAKRAVDTVELSDRAREMRSVQPSHRLKDALSDKSRINIIAEFKKASPSKGVINDGVEPADIARLYEAGGAVAMSVLTEEDHFNGSLDDLRAVRAAVDLPILRKDFVFDEFQIYEAAEAGADVILLIAAMLDDNDLSRLRSVAEDELGLDALVEVHTLCELERAKQCGAKVIGVNNRDLKSFRVTLGVSRTLIRDAPADAIMVSESGLQSPDELQELQELGYAGFLVGETLMRTGDPARELRRLSGQS
jgi:indole-3-glycerol phosphate synthase